MAEMCLTVAQTMFTSFQSPELTKICSARGYESQLENLNKTFSTITKVLLRAESAVELSDEQRRCVEELKDVVYEAEASFDEFVTNLELKQIDRFYHPYEQVHYYFCSDYNRASTICDKVIEIENKFNATVNNRQKLSLGVVHKIRRETTSVVVDVEIIGREKDKEAVIENLLESSKDQDVRFLTIVGVGGVGKTALAQLVYNDESIKKEFGELRYWVCVSDQDKKQFDVKAILRQILSLVTHGLRFDNYEFKSLQEEFQKHLGGKKYLLILDDVWNESQTKWDYLENVLKLDQAGGKVLITTRSEITALFIGNGATHKLGDLSWDDSWRLFERVTGYKQHQEEVDHLDFKKIGMNIVKKCHNNPLAIHVVGSLLYEEDIYKWNLLESSGLSEIDKEDEKKIMYVLQLSYHNLTPSLKSCFAYCSVFPKDFRMNKETLIKLWIAQGYIIPPHDRDQTLEDAAKEQFLILLQRCFFQDVNKDRYGDITSVKMHDLMHDVAQEVVGQEIINIMRPDAKKIGVDEVWQLSYTIPDISDAKKFGDEVRHLSFTTNQCPESSGTSPKLRSYIDRSRTFSHPGTRLVDKVIYLRVLHLRNLTDSGSLESIGELLHLRYLSLSLSSFEKLPASFITKLCNLQTFILSGCRYLRELPPDFSKLKRLRHLDIDICSALTYMPSGMGKLTSLRVLTDFVVGSQIEKQRPDELADLETLTNLTGRLAIRIGENYKNVESIKSSYLGQTKDLEVLSIKFVGKCVDQEAVLEKLEPHPNLKVLSLQDYEGMMIPWWRRAEENGTIPFNLVIITICRCKELRYMPSFSKLPYLKELTLSNLDNLEYMEKATNTSNNAKVKESTFFPSLEFLDMMELPKLKGWNSGEGLVGSSHCSNRSFPNLSLLYIWSCHNLAFFPPCPRIKRLICDMSKILMEVVGNGNLTSCLTILEDVDIIDDVELKSLSEIQDAFKICAPSLRRLSVNRCKNLVRISEGLEHLTVLESLDLSSNEQLQISEDDFSPSKSLPQSLHTLTGLKHMINLPKGMQ